jgi:hypothetical protein
MTTVKQALLILISGTALLAQQQNVMITRAGVAGPVGMGGTFNFVAGELVGGNPVKAAPYSAEAVTESAQTLADGNRIVNRTTATVYRDSEGRERREQSLPAIGPFAAQGEAPKTIFISDPVAGVNYSLDPAGKIAVKLPSVKMPDFPPPPKDGAQIFIKRIEGPMAGIATAGPQMMYFRQGSGDGSAPQVEQLGSKVIEGVSADGTRTTITIAAGQIGNDQPIQIVHEMWRSPELQVIVQSTHSDPRMGTTSYSLKNVSRAEPPAALFQVPSDYTFKDVQTFQKTLPLPPAPPQ